MSRFGTRSIGNSRRGGAWPASLAARAPGVLASLAAHAAALAILMMPARPLPAPEEQAAAIMVELVPHVQAARAEAFTPPPPGIDDLDEAAASGQVLPAREDIEPEEPEADIAEPSPERFESAAADGEIPLPTQRPDPPRKAAETTAKPAPARRDLARASETRDAEAALPAQLQGETDAIDAAPATRAGTVADSAAVERWQSRLMAHLERHKRYPVSSRRRREQGIAHVRFRIDPAGTVLAADLVRSSSFDGLDGEAVALVMRASPVPAPPPGTNGLITVPIRFSVR